MSGTKQRIASIFQFAAIFFLVWFATQFVMQQFFPDQFGDQAGVKAVVMQAFDPTVKSGHYPELTIRNTTDQPFALSQNCPMPPVEVYRIDNLGQANQEFVNLETTETAIPCEYAASVPAGGSTKISLAPWKYSLFGSNGHYEVRLPEAIGDPNKVVRFEIYQAGTITKTFRTFITKPLLNFLIFIASLTPGHNLGIAIIILTILVKILLFFPTQHALEGQRRMQEIQPKIEELRRKFKNDPQRLNQETMKLWKAEKINPFQSCLPILLQFPVLIGLFFVIRDGSSLELSRHLIYDMYQNLPWTFGMDFLWMDLAVPDYYVIPPLLVIMQFFQMKLTFSIAKKKKAKTEDNKRGKEKPKGDMESFQETQQKVMMYGLPLMIGFFAFQFPAAVSLYWGVNTIFAIGQQIVVNRKHL